MEDIWPEILRGYKTSLMEKIDKLKAFGFDLDSYQKAKRYERENLIVGLLESIVLTVILLLFVFFGTRPLFRFFQDLVRNIWAVRICYSVVFFGGFFFLSLPFQLLNFRIEHKYDLSNQNMAGWVEDQLKSFLISFLLSLVGFLFLFWVLNITDLWWFFTWLVLTAIMLFVQFIGPTVLMPLFYDFEPLEKEELKEKLESLAKRAGLEILGVFNMQVSDKTDKGIGALAGIGSSRRIILSDTLIKNHSDEEIEAIIAHEMGHHKHGDIWLLLAVQSLFTFLGLLVVSRVLVPINSYLNLGQNISSLPVIIGLLGFAFFLLSPLRSWLTRTRERHADDFSLKIAEKPEALGKSLIKLSEQNLGNPAPPKLVEILFHDHPSVISRVERSFAYEDDYSGY